METFLELAFSFLLIVPFTLAKPHAVYSPRQYSVLDGNITFTARIIEPDREEYTIYWSEVFRQEQRFEQVLNKNNSFSSEWTVNFPSDKYHPGNFSVLANTVYKWPLVPFPIEFDTQLVYFTLTDHFTGRFGVNNVTKHRRNHSPYLVSTRNLTEIRINLDSPAILKNATNLTWSWFDSNTSIANTSGPVLYHNFTSAKTYHIFARLEADFNGTLNPNKTLHKSGNFTANITALVPIMNVNVSGDTWYRDDGRLLRIKITCEGTGPYKYCLILKEGAYNVTGNETCLNPEVTNDCEIPFAWLLGEGIHTLITVIENDLGRYVNQTAIHVYKVARVLPLSLVLVPITCSLIAMVLIIFGIGYFWENRKRYNVEVADFDFGQDNELPYMTFMERLKDAMSANSMNRMNYSSADDHEPILSRTGDN